MALPGRLDSSYGVGVNKLIQEGAKLVTEISDVLKNFPQFTNNLWKKEPQKQITFWDIKDEYKEILGILQENTLSAEEIMQKTKQKDLRNTLNILMDMELDEIITQEIGLGYKINKTIK